MKTINKETASSNDSLELKLEIKPHSLYFSGDTCTQYIVGSELGSQSISVQGWADQEPQIKQTAEVITAAVNNYNALKQSNKELIENLERILDRIKENGYQNDFPSAYNRAVTALQKAKQL